MEVSARFSNTLCKHYQNTLSTLMFIFAFGIHSNFFIALPTRLKTCTFFFFRYFQGKKCTPEKSGASQRFSSPERDRSMSGAQFVQACVYKINLANYFMVNNRRSHDDV